jgi:hypothetical protein
MLLNGSERPAVTGTGIDAAREIFKKMGISASKDRLEVIASSSGYTVRGTQNINGREVFNRTYELRFDDRGFYAMGGGMVLGKPLICDTAPSVTMITAIFAFVDAINENGTPCKEIRNAELGYYAESSAPNYTQLIPVWKIDSDLRTFYINAVTLELKENLPK